MKPLTHTNPSITSPGRSNTHYPEVQQYNCKRWPGNLFFTDLKTIYSRLLPAYKHKNLDTCSTEMWHRQVQWPAFVRLLCQITPTFTFHFSACFVSLLFPFSSLLPHILSLQYSSFLFLPTFHSLSIFAVVPALSPLLSDKLFVGRNLRHGLLSCSQVLSLFVSMPLYPSEGHRQSPPLSLSLGVTVSSPPWLSQELTISLTHQNTNTMCWYSRTICNIETKCCFKYTQTHKMYLKTYEFINSCIRGLIYMYILVGVKSHAHNTHLETFGNTHDLFPLVAKHPCSF